MITIKLEPGQVALTAEQLAIAAEALRCQPTLEAVMAALEFDAIYPPVPTNQMDWGVTRLGNERIIGWGATPQAAADDAIDTLEAFL